LYNKIKFETPYELITDYQGTFYYREKNEEVKESVLKFYLKKKPTELDSIVSDLNDQFIQKDEYACVEECGIVLKQLIIYL
jgi:hypothetical protein